LTTANRVRLGDVLEVQSGFAFKKEFFTHQEGVPLIRIRDLDAEDTETKYNGPYREEFLVSRGDFLIGMDGEFRCHIWKGTKSLLNQRVCRLRNFASSIVPMYLYYGIQRYLSTIEAQTAFVTVKHISGRQIEEIEMPLPAVDDQQRIVDLLSRAENIVRMRREAEARAKEIIPALFLDMFGDPATNPKGWASRKIGEAADVQGGLQVTTKRASLPLEVPYLRVANVHRTHLNLSEIKLMRVTDAELGRTRLLPGDLLVIEGHGNPAEIGRVGIWPGGIDPCVHQNHLIRVRCRPECFRPTYAWAYLNSIAGRRTLLREGKTTSGLNTISLSNVKRVNVPRPPIVLQGHFEKQVREITGLQASQDTASILALQAFQSLLAGVFGTGKK
jgi:type I restriction enzyme, S subunit